ncbi:MAG: hypothetical protein SFX72_21635 [Isosphaeraceae bacterium]|nr:hypothetical protein [Isosphaeraceae bacterium]
MNGQLLGGLVVLGCALFVFLVQLSGWELHHEEFHLGVVVFLSLGTVLTASGRRRADSEGAESPSDDRS